jgi:hypothetical protein
MVYLEWNPGLESCVFAAPDDARFWELCEEGDVEPVTTIPSSDSEAERRAAEARFQAEAARRLPLMDERAHQLLASTHPDGVATVGLILTVPLSLNQLEQLAAETGTSLIAAWRTDYECFSGLDDWPAATASRFAYLDGVERAERLRQEMENSTTPVTGAHIPLNTFAVMAQEAVALRQPGVLLEAAQVDVPVAAFELLYGDPRIERIRIVDFPTESFDLSRPPLPPCDSG